MKKCALFKFGLWCILVLGLYCSHALADMQVLEIPGAGPPTELLRSLANAFNQRGPNQRIEIPPTIGMGGAIDAVKKSSPLVRMPRQLSTEEEKQGLRQLTVARQALVFVTGAGVTVSTLSRQQLADAFSGKVSRWSALGGSHTPIRVVYREETSESLRVIRRSLAEFASLTFSVEGRLVQVESAVPEVMQHFHWSLGWMSLNNARAAKGLRVLTLDGVAPEPSSLKAGTYPLHMDVVLVYRTQPTGLAKDFIDFIYSAAGRAVIEAQGALPMAEK